MIGGRQPLRGKKPADRRIRVERPHAQYFRYTGKGIMTAKPAATAPTTALGRWTADVRRVFIGKPLASDEESGERLSKKKALAIFSSDAISSSAYATEEILVVLLAAGAVAFTVSIEIAVAIAILLAVVSTSYRQIGHAYPDGGGAYAVGRANFGKLRGHRGRGCAARRLHPHGRGVHLVRRGTDHLRHPRPAALGRGPVRAVHPADDPRQPPGPAGVGQHLCHPDVPVRVQRPAHDRAGRVPGGRAGPGPRPPPIPCRAPRACSSR